MEESNAKISMMPTNDFVQTIMRQSAEMYIRDWTDWDSALNGYTVSDSSSMEESHIKPNSNITQESIAGFLDSWVSQIAASSEYGTIQISLTNSSTDGSTGPCPKEVEL